MNKPVFTMTVGRTLWPETDQYEYVLTVKASLLIDKKKDFLIPDLYIANTFVDSLKERFNSSFICDKVYANVEKVRQL